MITSLTKEQEKLLADINKKVVDKFYNWGKVDESEIENSVAKLYGYANLKKPRIEYIQFPDCSAVGSAVDSAVGSAVRSAVGSAVDSAVDSAVRSAVDSAVDSAVRSAVDSAVDSAVRSAVRSAVGSWWYRWYREDWYSQAYMNFFSKIVPDFPVDMFEEYRKIYDAGFLYLFMFEKVCFVVKMPEKIDQWVGEGYNRRLHSDTKEAIDVSGLKLYFLNGVQFNENLWRKVVSRQMPFEEILAIPDVDQRNQAMKYGDRKKFLDYNKAQILDSHQKSDIEGNVIDYKLYFIPKGDLFSKDVHFMFYECPSTRLENMSGVPEFKTVKDAMAWKSLISPEQWINMIPLVHES
jgi:hypothetical protein